MFLCQQGMIAMIHMTDIEIEKILKNASRDNIEDLLNVINFLLNEREEIKEYNTFIKKEFLELENVFDCFGRIVFENQKNLLYLVNKFKSLKKELNSCSFFKKCEFIDFHEEQPELMEQNIKRTLQ